MNNALLEKIDHFFEKYPLRTYPAGQILIFANEQPEHVFYIQKGCVKKYDITYRGDEIILNLYKYPAFFPMSWVLNKKEANFFYSTEQPSDIRIAPIEDTYNFVTSNPDIIFDLLQRVYRGMDGVFERLVLLMAGSAKSRLIYEIILDGERFGTKLSDNTLVVSTNEQGLAARAGLSRETVSREMHKLKEKRFLSVTPQGIVINNIAALKRELAESRI